LVRDGQVAILLDCGPGIAAKLLAEMDACDLDAVIISHMHPDHILDLVALGYALMTEWIAKRRHKRVILWVPQGGEELLRQLSGLFGHRHWRLDDSDFGAGYAEIRNAARRGDDWFFTVFNVREYQPGDGWSFGATKVTTFAVDHFILCAAMRLEMQGRVLVYSGDTRWVPDLPSFATGADILVAEGHFSGSQPPGGAHLSPAEAGRLANLAGARHLVLTHIASPGDADAALTSAAAEFSGPITLAIRAQEMPI
jgi:ribonuclease BN (tRNA processing enzyme)